MQRRQLELVLLPVFRRARALVRLGVERRRVGARRPRLACRHSCLLSRQLTLATLTLTLYEAAEARHAFHNDCQYGPLPRRYYAQGKGDICLPLAPYRLRSKQRIFKVFLGKPSLEWRQMMRAL